MSDAAAFFPGSAERRIGSGDCEICLRAAGEGPPLLLHGDPLAHVYWHRTAPELSRHATPIVASQLAILVHRLDGRRRRCRPCSSRGEPAGDDGGADPLPYFP
jgi:hypothetical protein